jgi:hypothetical protein
MINTNWKKLSHKDGYEVAITEVEFNSVKVCVTIDNFSIAPVSLQRYTLDELQVDADWINVFAKDIKTYETHDEALVDLKLLISKYDYTRIRRFIKRHYQ